MSQHDINIRIYQLIAELTQRVTEIEGQLEAYRNSVEIQSDRTPTHTNVTTTPAHSLPGRDSVRQPNKTESSLNKETLGVAEKSEVAAQAPSANYSKRPSGRFRFSPHLICVNSISILPDICRRRSYSLEGTC